MEYPTNCSHDELIVNYDPVLISAKDIARLDKLGFIACPDDEHFISFRYGSC